MEGKEEILPSPQSYQAILQCLGLAEELVTKNDETTRLSQIIEKLTTTEELAVQQELNEVWMVENLLPDCFAIDTRTCKRSLPIFKFSHHCIPGREDRSLSDPNFISSIAPMFLEMKSLKGNNDNNNTTMMMKMGKVCEALVQVIERVHLCAIQNETLQRVFGFATAGARSWIFIVQRDYSKLDTLSGKLCEAFDLYPIETASIIPVWHAFNRLAKADSQVFVQPVAFTLAHLLSVLGYHAGYCSIQYETNRSNVFTITPGVKSKKKTHSSSSGQTLYFSTPAASCRNSFVIKLIEDLSSQAKLRRATNELEMLSKLKGSPASGYLIATVSYCGSSMGLVVNEFDTSFLKNNHMNINEYQEKTSSISSDVVSTARFTDPFFSAAPLEGKECSRECIPGAFWFNYRRFSVEHEYRSVIMYKGLNVVSYSNLSVRNSFFHCLEAIHDRGILHCDLRPNNLMEFSDDYYIVDFDVAVALGNSRTVNLKLRPGGQKDFLIETKTIMGADQSVNWTKTNDLMMLIKALDNLPSTPVFSIPEKVYESADITIRKEDENDDDDDEEVENK
jgi:serine/threonine protein kinase